MKFIPIFTPKDRKMLQQICHKLSGWITYKQAKILNNLNAPSFLKKTFNLGILKIQQKPLTLSV
jgi:hypothetical protein